VHTSHRAALLRKGVQDETFRQASAQSIGPRLKRDWKRSDYEAAWKIIGKPELINTWYGQFGWPESPAEPDSDGKINYYWPM
jgi:hypothetical protein